MIQFFRAETADRVSIVEAELPTSLGGIGLSLTCGEAIVGDPAHECWRVRGDARVLAWDLDALRAELLVGSVSPRLPPDMSVSGCHVGVWRIRAKTRIPSCEFFAAWSAGIAPGSGGPNSGQGLVAQTWDDIEATVSLGTMDAEWLNRFGTGWEMPESWRALVDVHDPTTVVIEKYRSDGLIIRLPELIAGEGGQLHFATAWAPRWPDDSATWFAVDLAPADALNQLGIG